MARKRQEPPRKTPAARIARIKDRIRALDVVSSGTLLRRTKVCGKPGCRCADDPDARHGPYYEWGRMKGGKLVHRTVTPEQAELLATAIGNYKTVRKLLRAWETETVRIMEAEKKQK